MVDTYKGTAGSSINTENLKKNDSKKCCAKSSLNHKIICVYTVCTIFRMLPIGL